MDLIRKAQFPAPCPSAARKSGCVFHPPFTYYRAHGDQDIIIPRGIDNRVAIDMVVKHIQLLLVKKSRKHQEELKRLGRQAEDEPLSQNVLLLKQSKQITAINTILRNPATDDVDFIFYFDRLSGLLVER